MIKIYLVEITSCKDNFMWYHDKIGQMYQVIYYTPTCYKLLTSKRIIWKKDCQIMKPN